jgi:ATP-dependent exoDNAse (exonuclease V) beta subunit
MRPSEPGPVAQPEPSRARWNEAIDRAERAFDQVRAVRSPFFRRPSGLREDEEAQWERAEPDDGVRATTVGEDPLARAVGIAVHDLLERWNFRTLDAIRESLSAAARHAARDTGLDSAAVESGTREVVDRFLETDLPAYLASVEILGREIPFLLDEGEERWTGTIDLLYRAHENELVVADYKTDRGIREEPPEAYRRQLDTYARAVARAFPEEAPPVRELLYVRQGRRIRL